MASTIQDVSFHIADVEPCCSKRHDRIEIRVKNAAVAVAVRSEYGPAWRVGCMDARSTDLGTAGTLEEAAELVLKHEGILWL